MNKKSKDDPLPQPLIADGVFPLQQPDSQAEVNIFALPYAGGGASAYTQWVQNHQWPDQWRFCPLQLPGRENRIKETPHQHMDDLIAEVVKYIDPYTHRPWALLGNCMGCKISFEVARYFSAIDKPPQLLFLMGSPSPDASSDWLLSEVSNQELIEGIKRLGRTPDNVLQSSKMLQTIISLLRADARLMEQYQAPKTATVDVNTVLVIADDDFMVPVSSVLQWQQHLTAQIDIHHVTGGHFFMFNQHQRLQTWLIEALQKNLN